MPRTARKLSETGTYHLMLRGINRQVIFEDKQDFEHFIGVLAYGKEASGFELFAYCLMDTHVHILLRVGEEPLEILMRRIASKYVYWYNAKYQRIGHLFQDRFLSEPVNDDAYFITVLRYIHRNPIKADLCANADEYIYSSYLDYMGRSGIVDTGLVLSMMSKEELACYTATNNDDKCLEMPERPNRRVTDEQARGIIERVSGCSSVSDFQQLPIDKRNTALSQILSSGVSIRQACRLTGLSFGIVRKFA